MESHTDRSFQIYSLRTGNPQPVASFGEKEGIINSTVLRLFMIKFSSTLALPFLLVPPSVAIAQDWQQWHKHNPTYNEIESQEVEQSRTCFNKAIKLSGNIKWSTEINFTQPQEVELKVVAKNTSNAFKSISFVAVDIYDQPKSQEEETGKALLEELGIPPFGLVSYGKDEKWVERTTVPAGKYTWSIQHDAKTSKEIQLQCRFLS